MLHSQETITIRQTYLHQISYTGDLKAMLYFCKPQNDLLSIEKQNGDWQKEAVKSSQAPQLVE
ncbi:MAG: hypothetical protein DYG89_37760 [Caldilinea sp. CFX5]|nr:hypothetical protein [Caldilinea sp. CFX5]